MPCEYIVYIRKDASGNEVYGCNKEKDLRELTFGEHMRCKGRFFERCRLRSSELNDKKPNKLEKKISKPIE